MPQKKTVKKSTGKSRRATTTTYSHEDKFCDLPQVQPRQLPPGIDPNREMFILSIDEVWVNGTVIHYCFFNHQNHGSPASWTGNSADINAAKKAFREWKAIGIGLEFKEVSQPVDAEIRIGFEQGGGSWSYIGTYPINNVPLGQRTMNFGWPLTTSHGYDTALHEIGHGLGAKHEHQNPNAGIDWNELNVYSYFKGSPNFWNKNKIDHNVLNKIPAWSVEGSKWDPNSIMHYQFRPPLIDGPPPYDTNGIFPNSGFSKKDTFWAKKLYPHLKKTNRIELKPYQSKWFSLAAGEQVNFNISPTASRKYNIQTFGNADTIMVLFEDDGNEPRYVTADDDSGTHYNSKINYRLMAGKKYILRVRLYFPSDTGESAVMMW